MLEIHLQTNTHVVLYVICTAQKYQKKQHKAYREHSEAGRRQAGHSPLAMSTSDSPPWASDAPPKLPLRDATPSLLRVLARGIPASAPARHRRLRPALEFHHGT